MDKVDVLAVIGKAAEQFGITDDFGGEHRAGLYRARAAIAELIAAAKRANGDHHAPDDCYATGPLTGDPIRDLVECPGCQLASALAALDSKP